MFNHQTRLFISSRRWEANPTNTRHPLTLSQPPLVPPHPQAARQHRALRCPEHCGGSWSGCISAVLAARRGWCPPGKGAALAPLCGLACSRLGEQPMLPLGICLHSTCELRWCERLELLCVAAIRSIKKTAEEFPDFRLLCPRLSDYFHFTQSLPPSPHLSTWDLTAHEIMSVGPQNPPGHDPELCTGPHS